LAQNGRPGPVLIDIPKDVGLEETVEYCTQLIYLRKIITVQNITLNEKTRPIVRPLMTVLPLYVEEVLFVRMVLKHYNSWRNFSTTSNDHFNGKSSYNERNHLS
jgi:hypothetical protein